jgi:hypothetical protein
MKFLTTSTVDHDYAVWGPFGSKALALSTCGNLPEPVDCSFHLQAAEQVTVNNVQADEERSDEQRLERSDPRMSQNIIPPS